MKPNSNTHKCYLALDPKYKPEELILSAGDQKRRQEDRRLWLRYALKMGQIISAKKSLQLFILQFYKKSENMQGI